VSFLYTYFSFLHEYALSKKVSFCRKKKFFSPRFLDFSKEHKNSAGRTRGATGKASSIQGLKLVYSKAKIF
jgi:hypothetical protein